MDPARPSDAPAATEHSAPQDEALPDAQDVPVPPAPETVHAWLAQTKPAAVLALLREPDFAHVGMGAFAGFRVGAQSYANPLVRTRLVREALKNPALAEKLQTLAAPAETPVAEKSLLADLSVTPNSTVLPSNAALSGEREQWKIERERVRGLRAERDQARHVAADAAAAQEHAETTQRQAEAARGEAERRAQDMEKEIARLKRRIERLQAETSQMEGERNALRKALKQAVQPPRTPQAAVPSSNPSVPTAASSWQTAAAHLLHRRRHDLALLLAEEVLRLSPRDPAALDMAAQAHEARREPGQAIILLHRLQEQAIADGRMANAVDAWMRALLLSTPPQVERALRSLLRALRPDDLEGIRAMRIALSRLQGLAPQTYALTVAQISRFAIPSLAEALMPPPGALTPDDPLPLGLPHVLTARQVLDAVRAGETEMASRVRDALGRLAAGSDDSERVRIALEEAAEEDRALLQPLLRTPRGPIVVDASNVALHGQEMLANPRPRLRALQAMHSALLRRGYFPILTIADANLPYQIDEPQKLEEMHKSREVGFVNSGTVADEVLLREAKRFSAPLVTNDYMTDWDPQGDVTKIRYTFSHMGDVWLDH